MNTKPLISYAQNREDLILLAFFPDVDEGFYVDVGANHPTNDSVTKLFYDRGWHGINIEPIESLHRLLEEERPRDINLAIGISDSGGHAAFTEFEVDGLSTFSLRVVDSAPGDTETRASYEVEVATLESVLASSQAPHIHFMKVDVEGYEYEVLRGNHWDRFRPEVLCIEAAHVHVDWRPILSDANYRLVLSDGLNEYYVADEAASRERGFRSAFTAILEAGPDYRRSWRDVLDQTVQQLERVQAALDQRTDQLSAANGEIDALQRRVREVERAAYGPAYLLLDLPRSLARSVGKAGRRSRNYLRRRLRP